jgi:hypothetical protein
MPTDGREVLGCIHSLRQPEDKYVTECYRYSRQMELACKTASGHGYIDSRKQLLVQVLDNVYFMGHGGVQRSESYPTVRKNLCPSASGSKNKHEISIKKSARKSNRIWRRIMLWLTQNVSFSQLFNDAVSIKAIASDDKTNCKIFKRSWSSRGSIPEMEWRAWRKPLTTWFFLIRCWSGMFLYKYSLIKCLTWRGLTTEVRNN